MPQRRASLHRKRSGSKLSSPPPTPARASSRPFQFAACLTPLDKLFAQWLSEDAWLPAHTVNATTGVVSINGQKAVYENRRRKGLGLTHGDDTAKHDHWNA
jgi:hypothetical protein